MMMPTNPAISDDPGRVRRGLTWWLLRAALVFAGRVAVAVLVRRHRRDGEGVGA